MPEPESILQQSLNGDPVAFGKLVEAWHPRVFQLAWRMVADREEAMDLTQETFIRVWKNRTSYREHQPFSTWIFTIATRLCLDHLRSRKVRTQYASNGSNRVSSIDPISADHDVQSEELWLAIWNAIRTLTPKQQTVFILRDVEGLDSVEVEQILKMSAGTIKSNLYYARSKVAAMLKSEYSKSR